MVALPKVDRFGDTQRFAIGALLVVASQAAAKFQIPAYRLLGYANLLAWAFLGTAFLPAFVGYLDADGRDDISTMKQLGILWVAGVGALVLLFAIGFVVGLVF